jgi:hypothetical protein
MTERRDMVQFIFWKDGRTLLGVTYMMAEMVKKWLSFSAMTSDCCDHDVEL